MYRKVNQHKFSKATLARLGSVMLLLVFAIPHLTAVAEEVTYSKLWGRSGELWSPTSRLPDFSYAGYNRGEHPLRELKADVSVKQFGAIGDGETDDTHAFKKAIEQSPGKTIFVPAGRYRITDFLYIRHTGTSLLGENPVRSILFFPTPLHTIKPNMGATTSGQPTSNYSWSGGFVFVTGSTSRNVLAEVTSQAKRGQRSLSVSKPEAFTVGQDVRLSLRDTERQSLARYLYADDPGPITNLKSRAQVSFLFRITKIDTAGKHIEFDRPLRSDVRLEWKPRLYDASCSVEDVGIQNLCFEFPVTPYKGHFTELGYNAIAMRSVRNCWVWNVRIHNADSGMFISGNNITLREISLTSERPRERQRKATGHHGITIGGQDNLLDNFQFETRFMHDITVTSGSSGNVAASGRGVDICFDHHCYAPHANLFTDIDLGEGSRMFQSGGGAALGRHSASWETFWCIRAQRAQKWPEGWGPDMMNFIAVQPGQESVTDAEGRWFEAIEPARLHPRNLYESQIRHRLQSRVLSQRASAAPLTAIRLAPKPIDHTKDRRVRRQPTVPPTYKEMPFVETAVEPALTNAEKQRGYLLFHRPITEPVYPNSKPLAHERLEQLVAFATPGEFEPLTFSIYPVRKLQNLKVRCSPLTCDVGEIPAAEITVRLGTYWNVGYPRYTSRTTYRRTPELLERVSIHSSPLGECQRYWIQVHVPSDAKSGLYKATVSVWDDGFEKAIQIPILFRVLVFKLHKDPAKHYSAYYYVRNRTQYADKPEPFVRKAAANEYRAMVEYGLDMTPTLYLGCSDGKTIHLPYPDELNQMLKAGLTGPIPVTAGNVISRFYRDTTPGGERGSHWHISKLPPPEFYERITAAFKAFEIERKAKGWPEFICCPIDEVAAARKEFGAKVYAAVKAAGIRTYATKDPTAADAASYRPYIDIWCSQPYSVPYEKIIGQDRYEYWCYPNHNAGEIKDRRVMCKGGRMTYGFGFWRSGYTTLIPWNWNWTPGDDQFDYLRGSRSGCGQRIDEDGEVIPAVYWECFREGNDDARYIYTLQQAIFQREGSPNAECRRAVAVARKLLRDMWDDINVQEKYLADGMWPSEEFNTRRWLLAQATSELLQHPAVRTGHAPSVLVTNTLPRPAKTETSIIDKALQAGNIQSMDLGGDFAAWSNGTKEGTTKITAAAGRKDMKELHWRVRIDHKTDGGEGGQYPVGWPRIARSFREGELDFSAYDYLSLLIRVDSNRNEVADDSTRLGLSLRSHAPPQRLFETRVDLGDRQRQWIPLRFSLGELIDQAGVGRDPWRSISNVQLFVAESDYAHSTDLTFQVRDIKLLRFTTPTIQRVYAPEYITLPRNRLAVSFSILGTRSVRKGSHTITVSLASGDGRTRTEQQQDLADGRVAILDISTLVPGSYRMNLTIAAADGTKCAHERQTIEAVDGLLARP